jgi:hypothetical protein
MQVLLKEKYSNIFLPAFVGWEENKTLNWPLFSHTCSGGNTAFLKISVVYTANKPENVEGRAGWLLF